MFLLHPLRTHLLKIVLQQLPCQRIKGNNALLVSLTVYGEDAIVQIDIVQPKGCRFTDPQTAGIHQLKHRTIPQSVRRIQIKAAQKGIHFIIKQKLRYSFGALRCLKIQKRILRDSHIFIQIAVKGTKGGQLAGNRGVFHFSADPGLLTQRGDIVHDDDAICILQLLNSLFL